MGIWYLKPLPVEVVVYDGANKAEVLDLVGEFGTVTQDGLEAGSDGWMVGEPLYIELDTAMLRADPGDLIALDARNRVSVFDAPSFNALFGAQTGAAHDVLAERARQISAEGWTPEHDDAHGRGELLMAAVAYLFACINPFAARAWWPWDAKFWKPTDPRRNLVKATALIIADIDRCDRGAARVAAVASAGGCDA